jgi:hypothetical protein
MSLLDKLKSLVSGDPAPHEQAQEHEGSFLQSPTKPAVVVQPSPEEIAAAERAEPPTTTVAGLADDEPRSDTS